MTREIKTAAGFDLTDPEDLEPVEGETAAKTWERWRAHEDGAIRDHVARGWRPGRRGKGIMTPDGKLYVWTTDGNENGKPGAPHHMGAWVALGLGELGAEFVVEPTGAVRLFRPPKNMDAAEALQRIHEADPRLFDEQSWMISKTATRVEEVDSTGEGDTAKQSERPFVYDPVEDVVYLGSPGSHHDGVLAQTMSSLVNGLLGVAKDDGTAYTFDTQGPYGRAWPSDAVKAKVIEALGHVPEADEDWTLSAIRHNLNWRPGTMGKGFLDDGGRVHTFSTNQGKFAWHSHADLANAMGVDMSPNSAVFISPAGAVDGPADARVKIAEADPALHVVEPEEWRHLGGLDDGDHLDWDPTLGLPGKGLVSDGVLYTWPTFGPDERPWHDEYVEEHHIGPPSSQFYIDPSGGVFPMWEDDVTDDDAALIAEVDPRLYVTPEEDWTIARTSSSPFDPWEPGEGGKGVLWPDGTVQVWRTHDDDGSGAPHHADLYDYLHSPGGPYPRSEAEFKVHPGGDIELLYVPAANKGGYKALQEVRRRINAADPRLVTDEGSGWSL